MNALEEDVQWLSIHEEDARDRQMTCCGRSLKL